MKNTLYLIVPCYNEEKVIEDTTKVLSKEMKKLMSLGAISCDSKIMFVDDGSSDSSWKIIKKLSKSNEFVTALKLSHNRGHQFALLAGIQESIEFADFTISIDCDLQQDASSIYDFIKKYNEGADIVYGVRNSRNTDKFFKKFTAELFYKIMNFCGCESTPNCADYRLISKKVALELLKFKESNLYLRGLFPYMGFKSDFIYFNVFERFAGTSKYNFKKMLSLATDGITSFSYAPIQMIFVFGVINVFVFVVLFIISLFLGFKSINYLFIISWIILFFAINLICIGIIGEYIGKIYFESKRRPRYSLEEKLYENIK